MHKMRTMVPFLLAALLISCSRSVSLDLEPEWDQRLPMNWRAEQALIVQDVAYFSNCGLGAEGVPGVSPIVAAFDLSSRELLWYIEREPLVPITSDNKRLFLLTDEGIVAISAADGSTLWEATITTENEYYESDEILIGDDKVFYSDNRGRSGNEVYALDARTGATLWTISLAAPTDWFRPSPSPLPWSHYGAMAYDRGTLYVRTTIDLSGREHFRFMLVALDVENGHVLWRFPFETPTTQGDGPPGAASLPAFGEREVYIGAFGGTSYAVGRETGEVLWERQVDINVSPVFVNNQIISVSGSRTVAAFDAKTGDLEWDVPSLGVVSPFVFFNQHVIFYTSDGFGGQFTAVDLGSGRVVHTLSPDFPDACGRSYPVALTIHDRHLYLVTVNCIHSLQISWE